MLLGLQPFTVVVGPPVGGARLGLALSIDLEHTLHEVHDPVLGHAGAGVEAALVPSIERETRVRDFDEQRGSRGMSVRVVAEGSGHHADIRLGLGFVIEGDGHLGPDVPACTQHSAQPFLDGSNRSGVGRGLRLANHQRPADQLDPLFWMKGTQVHEPLVLQATPVLRAREAHRRQTKAGASRASMSRRWDTAGHADCVVLLDVVLSANRPRGGMRRPAPVRVDTLANRRRHTTPSPCLSPTGGEGKRWRYARFSRSVWMGRERMRLPVSAKMALHTAGATLGTPGSPRPPAGWPESR